MSEFATTFATSAERVEILRGFKRFRDELRALGFKSGFQWVDGSFVEKCEVVKGRPPSDVDVVSVLRRPDAIVDGVDWIAFVEQYGDTLLDQAYCKDQYSCDAYFIDLDTSPDLVSQQSAYWFGLFSHQRETFRWKGMLQINLQCDDDAAMVAVEEIVAAW